MLAVVRFSPWIVAVAWRAAPGPVLAALAISLLVAGIPSAQVIVMARFVAELARASAFDDVMGAFAALVLLIALTAPLNDLARTFRGLATDRVRMALIADVADIIATISPARIATAEVAETIEKGNRAAQDQLPYTYSQVVSLGSSVLSVAGVIVTLWVMSPLSAMLVLLSLVPILVASERITRINARMWDEIGPMVWRERYLHGHLVGASSARELFSLGGAARLGELVKDTNRHLTARKARTYPPILGWSLAAGAGTSLLLGAALAALVVGVRYGPEAAGGVYGVIAATGAVTMFGMTLGLIVEATAPYERFRALETLREDPVRPVVQDSARRLVVRGLGHTYPGASVPALVGLDLTVERGQIVALVGVNGAGKTTAIDSIVGNLESSSQDGVVAVDGSTRQDMGRDGWSGCFGVLSQDFGRYELTVRQSLMLGSPDRGASDAELWESLEFAGAAEWVRRFPDGLDQQLGSQWQGGTGLSGGQWQRLSLARIHRRDAPIWILDEPTSAIDAEAEQSVFRRLRQDAGSRITIVVSHRAWTLKEMDEIIVLDEGRVIERGRFEELIDVSGRFAEIFSEQRL